MIEKQNDKRIETAVQTIESGFMKAEWTTFQSTTQEWISQKYGVSK
jgi:hypothetical protein